MKGGWRKNKRRMNRGWKKGRKESKKRLKNNPKKSLKVKKNLKTWRVVKEEQVLWLLLVPKLCAGRCTSPLLLLCYCCYEFKTCTTGSTRANSRKLHSAEFENWVLIETIYNFNVWQKMLNQYKTIILLFYLKTKSMAIYSYLYKNSLIYE